jgi:hypothetical protein
MSEVWTCAIRVGKYVSSCQEIMTFLGLGLGFGFR